MSEEVIAALKDLLSSSEPSAHTRDVAEMALKEIERLNDQLDTLWFDRD